jgi:hypothetical protein
VPDLPAFRARTAVGRRACAAVRSISADSSAPCTRYSYGLGPARPSATEHRGVLVVRHRFGYYWL